MRRFTCTVLATLAAWSLCTPAAAEDPVFSNRQNVNILSTYSPNMNITDSTGNVLGAGRFVDSKGNPLSGSYRMFNEGYTYDSGSNTSFTFNNYLMFDFGDVQSVETIRMRFYADANQTLWVSNFEVWWGDTADSCTNYVGSISSLTGDGRTGITTLDAPINTQFMKLVPIYDSVRNPNGRLNLSDIRVFGAPSPNGFSPEDASIDLISSTGLFGGASGSPVVTIDAGGGASVNDGLGTSGLPARIRFVDDNPPVINRDLIFPVSAEGAWIEVRFTNGVVYDFDTLGISGVSTSKDALFTLEVLTGVDALGQDVWELVKIGGKNTFAPFGNGSLNGGYFDLPANAVGTGIRLTLVNNGGAANWINDIQLFGTVYVPEPATMTLLALGGLALLRRRARA